MFCQDCGSKQEVGARFCVGCGKAVAGQTAGAVAAGRDAQPIEAKVFFDQDGLLVNDVVFKTSGGASYPIRNISSVSVERVPASGWVIAIASIITLFGLFIMIANVVVGGAIAVLGVAIWSLCFTTGNQLKLGAGGIWQTAVESQDRAQLDDVAKAIGESILHIQRGAGAN